MNDIAECVISDEMKNENLKLGGEMDLSMHFIFILYICLHNNLISATVIAAGRIAELLLNVASRPLFT